MNKIYDIVILTDQRYLTDSNTDAYKHNVYYEDAIVKKAIENQGLNVMRLAWDDADFDWSTTKAILFRTTWDYFYRFDEFSKWLSAVTQQTIVFNSEALIHWNLDKHYLIDLKQKGINTTETHFIEKGSVITLQDLHQFLGWSETVLKPCVSGSARHTYKLSADNLEIHEPIFQNLILEEAMLLQPFQTNIIAKGELSMMVFNGEFTHAVLKKVKSGDFRVQDDFGGSVQDYKPSDKEINFAEAAVKACIELPIYARVDIFTDNNGCLALAELELIEPELWFRHYPEAANVLAKTVKSRLYA